MFVSNFGKLQFNTWGKNIAAYLLVQCKILSEFRKYLLGIPNEI